MTILNKQDWQLISSYLAIEKYNKERQTQNERWSSIDYHRNLLFGLIDMLPELNSNKIILDSWDKINSHITINQFNNKEFLEKITENIVDKVDLNNPKQMGAFLKIITKTETHPRGYNSIVNYLLKRFDNFADLVVNAKADMSTLLNGSASLNLFGLIAKHEAKTKKTPYKFDEDILNKFCDSKYLDHYITTNKFKTYSSFFEGLAKSAPEDIKKFVISQPNIFNKIPEAKQWLNDLPEDVYQDENKRGNNNFLKISSKGTITISRTLKFNLIDIFASSREGDFTQEKINTAISFYVYKALASKIPQVSTNEDLSNKALPEKTYKLTFNKEFNYEGLDEELPLKMQETEKKFNQYLQEIYSIIKESPQFRLELCKAYKRRESIAPTTSDQEYLELIEKQDSYSLQKALMKNMETVNVHDSNEDSSSENDNNYGTSFKI